jgi:hypothetical protein
MKIDSVLSRPFFCEKYEEKNLHKNFPAIDSVAFSQVLTVYYVLQNNFIGKECTREVRACRACGHRGHAAAATLQHRYNSYHYTYQLHYYFYYHYHYC